MSTHIRIPCPKCHETLNVRREDVGKKVGCKHCKNTFLVRDPEALEPLEGAAAGPANHRAESTPGGPEALDLTFEGAAGGAQARPETARLEADLARVRAERNQLRHD